MDSMRWRRLIAGILAVIAAALLAADDGKDAEPAAKPQGNQKSAPAKKRTPRVRLIRVNLPLTGAQDTRVKRQIDQALANTKVFKPRPILVLEFRTQEGKSGEGTQYERALSLARYLVSSDLSRVRTVAYLPQTVTGHGVLVALACEEIIMAEKAELGAAGAGETDPPDATMRTAYEDIARRRRTIPAIVALAMLDKERSLLKVETQQGPRYVDSDGFEKLRKETVTSEVKTLSSRGDFARFTGQQLRVFGFVSHLAADHREVAAALRLPPNSIREDPSLQEKWQAIRVELSGRLTSKSVLDAQQAIQKRLQSGDVNLLVLQIDSPGGAPPASVQLANYLAEIDSGEVRTVAYVARQARGDAVLPALACDQLAVGENVVLGGPGEYALTEEDRDDLLDPIQKIAKRKGRDWSLMKGLVDSELRVYKYEREGGGAIRYLSEAELESLGPDEFKRAGELNLRRGIDAERAEEYGLAQFVVASRDELLKVLHVDQLEEVRPSRIVTAIERLAAQPWLARTLLFIAFFAFISEASAPGLGAPGFVSALCFLLFFWIQFLNGTAGWLEVVLFVGGVFCIAVEILAIPGFGVFGIGGILMVLSSILLATQTFVIPRNAYQYEQLPGSLFTVIAAMSGTLVAMIVLRNVLPHAPIFRRMMLLPPVAEEREVLQKREALVDYHHLLHTSGMTTTQLTPSGKARFGDDIVAVISRGSVIAAGEPVIVTDVQGNRVIVESVEERA